MSNFQFLVDVPHLTAELLHDMRQRNLGVELSHFALPENLDPKTLDKKVSHYADLLRDFELPRTLHGAFYDLNITSREPKIRQVCFERMIESIVIAQALGMHEVVFHTNFKQAASNTDWKRIWTAMQVEYWAKIAPIAAEHDMICLLENTTEPDPSYLIDIATAIDSPNIKICLDTGHTRCFTNTQIPLDEWARKLSPHLACIHLHTNRGTKDEHLAYCHPEGVLDFEPFFAYLEAQPQPPIIVVEVKTKADYEASYQALRLRYPHDLR
jgi:sugar phosphate isomerase/epimerase